MGIFSKLAFWKKDDGFDFDELANKEMGTGLPVQDNLGLDRKPMGLEEKSMFPDVSSGQQEASFGQQQTAPPFGQPAGVPQQPIFQSGMQQQMPAAQTGLKDIDLINSKLDTLKAILNSMDQRLANIERSSFGNQKKQNLW